MLLTPPLLLNDSDTGKRTRSLIRGVGDRIDKGLVLDCEKLVIEHRTCLAQGQKPLDIIDRLTKELHFTWGGHHGDFQACATPKGDLTHFKTFLSSLGIDWSPANGPSINFPDFFLCDPRVFRAVFGTQNMYDIHNGVFRQFVEEMRPGNPCQLGYGSYPNMSKTLKSRMGLDIKGDWSRLTGQRDIKGNFISPNAVYVGGQFYGDQIFSLYMKQNHLDTFPVNPSCGRIFFLGEK